MDAYLVGFAVIGVGMILAGFNLIATIIHYRAPGMTWGRIPIFVWSVLATSALLTLATPVLVTAGLSECWTGRHKRLSSSPSGAGARSSGELFWSSASGGLHHGSPGFGIVAEDAPRLHAQAAVRLSVAAAG